MDLNDKARWIRREIVEMAAVAGEGHISSGMSCIEMLVALYYTPGLFQHRPDDPKWEGRDRLWLSKGHGVLPLYPILADRGYFSVPELRTFCQDGSRLGIHAEPACPGIEAVFGSLGHGFNLAVGASLAAKMDGKNHTNVVLLGDGECYEGQIWEAAMFAAHHRLDNLVVMLDRNGMCVCDFTEHIVAQEPFIDKWNAWGWETCKVDGHNIEWLQIALSKAMASRRGFPKILICDTIKGRGISFMENEALWHGGAVTDQGQLDQARTELADSEGR